MNWLIKQALTKLTKKHSWFMEKWILSRLGCLYRSEISTYYFLSFFVCLLCTLDLQLQLAQRVPWLHFLSFFSVCTHSSSHLLEHVAPLPGIRFPQDGETFYHCDTSRRQLLPINQIWEVFWFLYPGVRRLNRWNGTFSRLPPGGVCQ